MTDKKTPTPKPQTQHQRWITYGANVAMVSVVVLLLAVAVTWLAQELNTRVDTTSAGLYSLKPQTVNIIRDNKQTIKIVSLYTRTKAENPEELDSDESRVDYVQPVADLLDEYKRKGKNIDVEAIDPLQQPTKVDQLIEEVTRKYGGEVQKYKAVVDEYPATFEKITKLANDESEKVKNLPMEKVTRQDQKQTLLLTVVTVQGFPRMLGDTKENIDKRLKQKIPDYRGATDSIQQGMGALSQMAGQIVEDFTRQKDDQTVPQEIRAYMAESLPRYDEINKLSSELDKRITGLGELKLDDLKQSLKQRDTILVMGENDMRVIPREKVWQEPQDIRGFSSDGKVRPRFAGEQQVSSAILSLTSKGRPKVVFVRPGGAPLAMPGIPGFQRGGPLSNIADRLREYNFDVLEKDISGMWAMQAQMQQMPTPPEPKDEEIKDAIWIVVNVPTAPQQQQFGPPPSVAPKLAEHLKNGGSALVLMMMRADPMAGALDEWGVKVRTDVVAVHEAVQGGPSRSADMIEEAQRTPFIFVVNEYGDHAITNPLRSLDAVLVPMVPVEIEPRQGLKATKLLPVPQTLATWGETDIEAALDGKPISYNAPKGASLDGDLAPPLWAGAAVEKNGAGRLVVIGSVEFAMNHILSFPDTRVPRPVARFPGNAELFCNSVFWLAKMETMIAISPAAMEVNRITQMSQGVLNTWRVGVLLVGLPGAVVLAGVLVYMSRRD
jgi:hypothetical protein